ncbi:MAG TPA: acyltransferase [Jiangellaceae bacterium]|nr:acyltransferase [Jiangellaceae bacterium]
MASLLGTRTTARLAALTGLRGVGMILIVISHTSFHSGAKLTGPFSPVLNRMDIGVALFFVLSAFFLYRSYAQALLAGRPAPSTGRFLINRAVRILPAYWITVLAAGVLLSGNHTASVGDILRQLTLTRIYQREGAGFFEGTIQTWSLETIVTFYLALPLLAWLASVGLAGAEPHRVLRRHVLVVAACLAASPLFTAAWAAGWIDRPLAHHWLPAYLGWFGAGMAVAVASAALATDTAGRLSRTASDAASAPGTVYLAAIAIFAIAATPVAGPRGLELGGGFEQIARIALLGIVATLIILPPALNQAPENVITRVLSSSPVQWLGTISYGVFLYHLVALRLVVQALEIPAFTGRFWTLTLATLALTIPAAWLSYRYIETPLSRLVRSRTSGASSASASAPRTNS